MEKKEIECDDLLSTCIQHEINHLDGRLIIDFLSKLKRDLIVKKLSKKNKILIKLLFKDVKKNSFYGNTRFFGHSFKITLPKWLSNNYSLYANSKKSNRGQKITKSPVHKIAELLNIEVRTPLSLNNNDEEYQYLKKHEADLAIVVAYGKIIPKKFLNLTKNGFINVHASLLPKYRGAAPIQRSIMNLEKNRNKYNEN